jgi:integrase
MSADSRSYNGVENPRHTPGHVRCPACDLMRTSRMHCKLEPQYTVSYAAKLWINSRTFTGSGRARYIAPGTIKSYQEYSRALERFFGKTDDTGQMVGVAANEEGRALTLEQIHVGHLREYQRMRSCGELGIPASQVIERCAKQKKKTIEQLKADPKLWQWVESKIESAKVEVNPNKINQELFMLVTLLRRAKLWTEEMSEEFEYLQHEEQDIPRALTPEQQDWFLQTASSKPEWRKVFLYATVAFRATATNCEMRNVRIGDAIQITLMYIQARTRKNKYRVRTIPLPPDAQWALRELIEMARELGATQPQHHLFPFRICRNHFDPSRPMSNSGIKKQWDEVRKAAGLPDFRIHDCRHTAITRLAEAGTPIGVIMSMSGHMSAKMVRHYTQISEQAQRMAVNAAYEGTMYAVPRRPAGSVPSTEGYPHRQLRTRSG